MTLRKNPQSGLYEADVRDRVAGRVHVSLKTSRKIEATERYAAVRSLIREGNRDLIYALRKRKLNVEAIEQCARHRRPFETLLESQAWPTLGKAVEEYLAWTENHPDRAANTYRAAEHCLRGAVDFFGKDQPIDRLTSQDVERFTTHLREKRELEGWSMAQHLIRLTALFNWLRRTEERRAREERRLARPLHSPVDPERVPKHVATKTRFLSDEEAVRLTAATPHQFLFPVLAGLLAGLRIGEVLSLRPPPHDIDLDVGLLIVQAKDGWRPKGKKRREVPIAPQLRGAIDAHVARYASAKWMLPSPYSKDGSVAMSDDTVNHALARIATDAGLLYGSDDPMGITYHTLRHTFASWLVMEGVDLFTVSRLLGHSTTKMVEETYGHLAPEHRRRAVDRLATRMEAAAARTQTALEAAPESDGNVPANDTGFSRVPDYASL